MECLCDVGLVTNLSASLGATVNMNSIYSSLSVATKAIDGNPNNVTGQRLVSTDCAATTSSFNPWLQVDLQRNILSHVLELSFMIIRVEMCIFVLVTI